MDRRMIIEEIDWRRPLSAFAPFSGRAHAHLLHGGERAGASGWSILVADPAGTLYCRAGSVEVDGVKVATAPFEALRAMHRKRRRGRGPEGIGAPFATGLVGFIGYEMGAEFEPSTAGPPSPFALPDMGLAAYDAAALFDRAKRRAFICARDEVAAEALKETLAARSNRTPAATPHFNRLQSNFSASRYCASVEETVERIRDGEFFQANLSQQLEARTNEPVAPLDIFKVITGQSDAAFGALLQYQEGSIISNSPERFFRIEPEADQRWRILAEPIKGTRPRGADRASDEVLAKALIADPKDRAENIMIADLTRNDLSRVCRDGSVREEAICALLSLARVHHLVSRVSGVLRDGLDPVDALAALFPCGSVTGAPKVQAMKAIAEMEGVGRGPYCGAIGYIDDSGAADFSVAIRTMMIERAGAETRAVCPVGGGVTLRSNPSTEYEETLIKAKSMLSALGLAEDARP